MKKHFLCIAIALALILSLCGCSGARYVKSEPLTDEYIVYTDFAWFPVDELLDSVKYAVRAEVKSVDEYELKEKIDPGAHGAYASVITAEIKDVLGSADENADIAPDKEVAISMYGSSKYRIDNDIVPRPGEEYVFLISGFTDSEKKIYTVSEFGEYSIRINYCHIMRISGDSVLYHKFLEGLVPDDEESERAIASGSEECRKCSYAALKEALAARFAK